MVLAGFHASPPDPDRPVPFIGPSHMSSIFVGFSDIKNNLSMNNIEAK